MRRGPRSPCLLVAGLLVGHVSGASLAVLSGRLMWASPAAPRVGLSCTATAAMAAEVASRETEEYEAAERDIREQLRTGVAREVSFSAFVQVRRLPSRRSDIAFTTGS
ncbi:hypothetical protein T492DRAFT_831966 [Pavlovales sp. CCMP2436]|nr:hypothetical protein T492DRAFT_831966 [Pavlovales sp. CCMP2436]